MNTNLKRYDLLKALSWYTLGNVSIKLINFISLPLFTALLNTNDYGIYGLFQSYLGIFEIILLFGGVHTIKMLKYDTSINYNQYVSSLILIPVIWTVLLIFLIHVYFILYCELGGLSKSIWICIFTTAGIASVSICIYSKLILEGSYKIFIVYSLINTIINISVSLILCYTVFESGRTYWARIIGGIIANICSCIYLLFFMKWEKPVFKYIKMGIQLGIPLLVHAIATQILIQSDKIIIGKMVSISAVGIYSAAVNVVSIPNTLLNSIENSWSPWFLHNISVSNYKSIEDKNNKIISLFFIFIIIFMLVSPDLIKIMLNKEYWEALYVLLPLSMAVFTELIYLIPLNLELYYKKSNMLWLYTSLSVVFNIVLDILCIKYFGYLAGAYVTCASRFFLFVLHYLRAKHIDANDVVNIKLVLLYLAALFFVNILCLVLINLWYFRWGLILLLIIVCVSYVIRNYNLKDIFLKNKL